MIDFKDKVAVVTGAASGIGLEFAKRCLAEGMKVVLADIDKRALVRAERKLKEGGAPIITVVTDVAKPGDVQTLAEKAFTEFRNVDVLFNNAGVGGGSFVHATSLNEWKWVLGTDLFGVIHGMHYFVPRMIAQDSECHVINTASIEGLVCHPTMGAYKVAKAGVVMLTETFFLEMQALRTKVKASVVCPGPIATDIINSAKHKPDELEDATPPQYSKEDMEWIMEFAKRLAAGMSAKTCADIIFNEAIQQGKFYILPNANQQAALDLIKSRAQWTTSGAFPKDMMPDWKTFDEIFKQT